MAHVDEYIAWEVDLHFFFDSRNHPTGRKFSLKRSKIWSLDPFEHFFPSLNGFVTLSAGPLHGKHGSAGIMVYAVFLKHGGGVHHAILRRRCSAPDGHHINGPGRGRPAIAADPGFWDVVDKMFEGVHGRLKTQLFKHWLDIVFGLEWQCHKFTEVHRRCPDRDYSGTGDRALESV